MLISVVLPVLNGEKYLRDCLNSVVTQRVEDIEILIVDAGSEDLTLKIAEEFQKIDSRVRILHSAKKSYGAQVNIGIKEARGKYLAILEADDMVLPDAYEIMLKTITESGAEIVKGNYRTFITDSEGRIISCPTNIFEKNEDLYGRKINARIQTNILRKDRYLWRALYDIDFIRRNNILLNETKGAAFQDTGFLMQTLICAENIIYIRDNVYLYRKDNTESSVYSPRGFQYIADEFVFVFEFLMQLNEEERNLYWPSFYLTLMDMIRTRCLLQGLRNDRQEIDAESIARLRKLLERGKTNGYLGCDARCQKDLFEISLFLRDPEAYMAYTREEVQAEKEDVEFFFERISAYKKVNVWGYGKTGSMFHMLLSRRKVNIEAIWSDACPQNVDGVDVLNADSLASQYDNNSAYVICAENYRYEIRQKLHLDYGVPYKNIFFYTLGTGQQLLFM